MRDPERIDEICNLIAAIWHTHPDWRLTQLLSNIYVLGDSTDIINYFQEDDETLKRLKNFAINYTKL